MLKGLKCGRDLVELHALFQIAERRVEDLLNHTQRLACSQHARLVQHSVK